MKKLSKTIATILVVLFASGVIISCAEDVTPQKEPLDSIVDVNIQISDDEMETDETDPDEGDEGVKQSN